MTRVGVRALAVSLRAVDPGRHVEHVLAGDPAPARPGQLRQDGVDRLAEIEQAPPFQDPGDDRGERLGHRHHQVTVARLHPRIPLEHDPAALDDHHPADRPRGYVSIQARTWQYGERRHRSHRSPVQLGGPPPGQDLGRGKQLARVQVGPRRRLPA
jgi:hypothetical protein